MFMKLVEDKYRGKNGIWLVYCDRNGDPIPEGSKLGFLSEDGFMLKKGVNPSCIDVDEDGYAKVR